MIKPLLEKNMINFPDRFLGIKLLLATTVVNGLIALEINPVKANILINGSFETGNTAGWNSSGNLGIISAGGHPCCVPSQGIYAVGFNGGNQPPNGTLSQIFSTIIGAEYLLSFDFGKGSTGSGTAALNVQVTGITNLLNQNVNDITGTNPVEYSNYSFLFIANSANTTLTFSDISLGTDNFDTLLDNISVTATNPVSVPEPQSITMVGLGSILGLITLLKRQLSKN